MTNDTAPANFPDKALTSDPRLVQLLLAKAFINGHSVPQLCDHLKVTLGFFIQLRNGIRKTEDIGEALAKAAAAYLEVPFGVVVAAVKRA
jgi:hypothetical protein